MATYAIGDIQGCYKSLKELLSKINFQPNTDTLWLTGDLVNRGPNSLETIEFLLNEIPEKNLVTVLGNHDLYLITLFYHIFDSKDFDHSLDEILNHKNAAIYINWLTSKPLLHFDKNTNYALVHAGIDPAWEIDDAIKYSKEIQEILTSNHENIIKDFLKNMYGNLPNKWNDSLTGFDRLRYITNVFTRMRFLHKDGSLDFISKEKESESLIPWFDFPNRKTANIQIIFGHWAALEGVLRPNIFGIDTGCIWNNELTALCLDSHKIFNVSCKYL